MTERDDDAAKLAGAMGWELFRTRAKREHFLRDGTAIPVPAATAPLGDRLAFVGRLCAELPGMDMSERLSWCAAVCAEAADLPPGDLVHAAIRAALATLAAKGVPVRAHEWREPTKTIRWPHCRVCGVILRADGKNKPECKGAPRVSLRARVARLEGK